MSEELKPDALVSTGICPNDDGLVMTEASYEAGS